MELWDEVFNIGMVMLCVVCAALAAGLTMGLLSLAPRNLQVKALIGEDDEAKAAESVLPLIRNHHLLLVTLLLFNAVANEALPVFLEKIVPQYAAVLISVSLVLIFGEIIPSALFTGRNQLKIVASLRGLVSTLIMVLYPIAYPISKVLDFIFGAEEEEDMSRGELQALMILQCDQEEGEECNVRETLRQSSDTDIKEQNMKLSKDEVSIMTGVLRLSRLVAKDAMLDVTNVSMISADVQLDKKCLLSILETGYSRLPVFAEGNRCHLLGFLLIKELIVIRPDDNIEVGALPLHEPVVVHPQEDLLEMLNIFQEGKSHIAFVSYHPEKTLQCIIDKVAPPLEAVTLGIITLENVIEKIIQEEILGTDSLYHCYYLTANVDEWDATRGSKTGGAKKLSIAGGTPRRGFQHIRTRSTNRVLGNRSKEIKHETKHLLYDDAIVSYGGTGSGSTISCSVKESLTVVPVPATESLDPKTPRIKHYKRSEITDGTSGFSNEKKTRDIVREDLMKDPLYQSDIHESLV